jgi:hypothetical protein
MKEETTVRENLMNEKDYSPYCGSNKCRHKMHRAKWSDDKKQFTYSCVWVSQFPDDFINTYIAKWKIE